MHKAKNTFALYYQFIKQIITFMEEKEKSPHIYTLLQIIKRALDITFSPPKKINPLNISYLKVPGLKEVQIRALAHCHLDHLQIQNMIVGKQTTKLLSLLIGPNIKSLKLILTNYQQLQKFMALISNFKSLHKLSISSYDIRSQQITKICLNLPQLQVLTLINPSFLQIDCFSKLSYLKNLKRLQLQYVEFIPEIVKSIIQNIGHIKGLKLNYCQIDNTLLTQLINGMRQLEYIFLSDFQITQSLQSAISKLDKLKQLRISLIYIDNYSLSQFISSLKNLKCLEMGRSQIDDEVIFAIPKILLNIQELKLQFNDQVTLKGIERICTFKNLKLLSLNSCGIKDIGLLTICKSLFSLQHLDIDSTGITAKSAINLSKLSHLRSLRIGNNLVVNYVVVKMFQNLKQLQKIFMQNCFKRNKRSRLVQYMNVFDVWVCT